jgi:hypothetical protein
VTATPAEQTPHRHAGPLRALAELEGQHLALQASVLIDRYDAMTAGMISGGAPATPGDLVIELIDWALAALDVLREVAR